MIRYVTERFIQNRALVERAMGHMLSMSETAKATLTTKSGARYDRGAMTLIANPGGVVQWRDTTVRRSASVDFQGVYVESGDVDPRLAAMRAMQWLRTEMDQALASKLGPEHMAAPGGQLRRACAALRAATSIAGRTGSDLLVQHPWGMVDRQALAYSDTHGPMTFPPAVMDRLFQGVEEACIIDAIPMTSNLRVEITGAAWHHEANDGPIDTLRLVAECGLEQGELELMRQ